MSGEEEIKLTWKKICIYFFVFCLLWSIRELVIRPVFLDSLNDILFQVMETIIKISIWTLPAIFLIKHYKNDMWISLKEMFINKPEFFKREVLEKKPKWFELKIEKDPLIVYLLFLLIIPFRAFISLKELTIHPSFQIIKMIEIVLFVGITEEIVFRGWLLNSFIKRMKLWPAILLNSVLFLFIHFPIWIYFKHDLFTILSNSFGVFGVSVLLCILFIKSKNIIIPILFHMIWNLLLTFFFGIQGANVI